MTTYSAQESIYLSLDKRHVSASSLE